MTDDRPKLPTPTLMLVTDRRLAGGEGALVRAITEAVEGGVNVVQVREKDLPPAELLPLACRIRKVTAGRALLVVNGPIEVALASGADGIHLPENSTELAAHDPASRPFGLLVGRSVHSLDSALAAIAAGVDYLVAGPVYETASHPGSTPAGVALIEQITASVKVPVIAIGGVASANAGDAVAAGASGIAVISAILGCPDRRNAARDLRDVLSVAWSGLQQVKP